MTLVMRRNVGRFIAVSDPDMLKRAVEILRNLGISSSIISIGKTGEADLQGIKGGQECPWCDGPIHPLPWACEVKSEKGQQSKDQINWQINVWTRRGGLYVLAKDVEDAVRKI